MNEKIGNSIIDNEHRELFRAVNKLLDECGKGKGRAAMEPAIKFLLDYVDKHFAHEENLQKKAIIPIKKRILSSMRTISAN